ncbi:protein of unknown function [uncultured Sphingopyxis sp.]|uniref:Uncharacterized protein n=1 Tax=uncultured Sphingopyxis sp. TaxID=310581 RepID=A0A1Y5PP72_9SPHN|nr:protein of unknown function [uncultured Sphingopyxis sp.]
MPLPWNDLVGSEAGRLESADRHP